ncbi:MAG TPA: outer membrane beta-barrel protein [Candidatus Enterousia intestinigallinarum]|uniref:Outer membrane beta-barrel protein n=1 Tax=Candidatus Enterousia intestinigallinarum TaxID=2840790 RepID=A0A9D1JX82_9PROT|nr:outer membrane beta-barrel protein [Candidatus Enterousia intestinigallinarum]
MKKTLALFMATAMFAPSAFAAEITPYVGVGLVIDKAGTSAKRVKFDASKVPADIPHAFVANAGDNMDFDMAFAGEITAGVKIGSVRAELEAAIRSASEDDYELFNGTVFEMGPLSVPAEIETSTSVRHNSYMANVYYDFDFGNSSWTPYIGAGVGLGVYRQKATVDIDLPDQFEGPAAAMGIPVGEMEVANDTLYEFEWQVGIGTAYHFSEDWAMDIGYRFNSSNVADEFVYAHEIKVGVRYTF